MRHLTCSLCVAAIGFTSLCRAVVPPSGKAKELLNYVDPMIGTDGRGSCFPGATTPMGMIQLSPSDDCQLKAWCSGYHYSDTTLKGFAHNHFSGTGLAGMGDLLLMPLGGKLQLNPGTKEDPDSGYRSRFSHDQENASPGYYSVELPDNQVRVELTASPRVGFHRYTFEKKGLHSVIFDPAHRVRGNVLNSGMEILSDTELRGYKYENSPSTGKRKVYFYVKFSKPFSNSGVTRQGEILKGRSLVESKYAGAFVSYNGTAGDVIEAAVAISYVDYAGAKANYESEAPGRTFDQVHEAARSLWRDKISRIEIDGATLDQKRIFYTGLYHAFIAPNIISDVNGNYMVESTRDITPGANDRAEQDVKKTVSPDLVQLSNISTWDTYRTLQPLWTIIDQTADAHLVNVLCSRYTQTDRGIGLWEALGYDNCCMPGYDGISVMADAALKELPGVDPELVFSCIRKASMNDGGSSPYYGKDNGVDDYIRLGGWIPAEVKTSVSKTTENNYYDWCVAELAHKLGKTDDEKYFRQRSLGYRNLYNPKEKYLWPRFENGEWQEMDLTNWGDKQIGLNSVYISGNIWSYSAYTPHDMAGAIALWGGKEKYAAWLDKIFTTEIKMSGEQHFDISGFIGSYGHGDEPGHQMPYNYMFVGQPWKTQELVNQIMTTFYFNTPEGYINNEDCGQMSAWYIFSSLGFYPVCPGDLKYTLGAPLHPKATIHLENGNDFVVEAKNRTPENIYVLSVTLNGNPLNVPFLEHADIMNGGKLVFEMGPKPNPAWATE